jgi:hypothetical protein
MTIIKTENITAANKRFAKMAGEVLNETFVLLINFGVVGQ